jgi:hypothetical protein
MKRKIPWIAAAVLFVLHQDCWNWSNQSLLFGFMPIGLAYHATFSVLAACVWALAVKFAWPDEVERWAEQPEPVPTTRDREAER